MPFPAPDPSGTALVTGASSGLGTEFARQLAEAGHGVTLLARREDRLHGLAGDLLVNNAGFATGGPLHASDLDEELRQVRLLCEAPVDLTRRFLPAMVARGQGAVISVSSTAAMQPLPNSAGYSAAKAHSLTFTEAVHAEVRRHGVHVTALCPPPVRTELFEKTDHPVERVPRIAWLDADEVVRIGLDGARRNKRVVVPKALARVQALVSRHAPHAIGLPLVERAFRPHGR